MDESGDRRALLARLATLLHDDRYGYTYAGAMDHIHWDWAKDMARSVMKIVDEASANQGPEA